MKDRNFSVTWNYAKQLDQEDPLKSVRSRFYQINGHIYMDGNSLGLCSRDAEETLLHVFDVWKKEGILIWNVEDGRYFLYSDYLAELCAPLIGAEAKEVCITGSTTVNIHQAIATLYQPTKEKYKILVDDLNFPTDRYAVDSQVRLKGLCPADAVKVVPSSDGKMIDEDAVINAMTPDVALIFLPAILYRSSQLLDMERLTAAANERGIVIGWDLCHSIGSVPHNLGKIDADYAVWCNYKHLAGGPGCTGGVYVNKKHFGKMSGLAGWFGNRNETQFQLRHVFEPAPDASGWQIGTPNILSMAPLEGALKIFNEVGMEAIREKSLHITAYMMYLIEQKLTQYGFSIGNPIDDKIRGGHIALEHDDAYRICSALKECNVIPDFREPNVIRLAPIALYNTYEEVYRVVEVLETIVTQKIHEKYSAQRSLVV